MQLPSIVGRMAKGGPYSGPVMPGGGQFGTVDVRDSGTAVEVTLSGWN